jgi:hypothetical protein
MTTRSLSTSRPTSSPDPRADEVERGLPGDDVACLLAELMATVRLSAAEGGLTDVGSQEEREWFDGVVQSRPDVQARLQCGQFVAIAHTLRGEGADRVAGGCGPRPRCPSSGRFHVVRCTARHHLVKFSEPFPSSP